MKKKTKILSLILAGILACGVTGSVIGIGIAQAGQRASMKKEELTISSLTDGATVALLDGEIYEFATTYKEKGDARKWAVGENYSGDRYAPKKAKITWENKGEPAAYYTLSLGLKKDLSDAKDYITLNTEVDVENLLVAKKYYYQITAHYDEDTVVKSIVFSFNTADLPRTVWIEGVSNTRDLGGRKTVDGNYRVKQGMIYRGGNIDGITENGKHIFLNVLGIKTDLDLRGNDVGITVSPAGDSVNFIKVQAPFYYGHPSDITSPDFKEALTTEIRTFANPDNYPVYLHCNLGRDRAGTLSYLINALLGVGEQDLFRDFETSFFSRHGFVDAAQGQGTVLELVGSLMALHNYLTSYGGGTLAQNTEAFCINHLGITKAEIDSIRNIMLEEVGA